MWTFGMDENYNGEVVYNLPFYMDVINYLPTIAPGAIALGVTFLAVTISLKQGEAAVLQNSFNGKSKGIVEGPKLVMKSPFTSARRYVSEKFNPESGSFSEGEDSSRISIRERLFEIPSNTATTSDGVEVDYVLSAVLQVKDAEKFISVSENPLATVVRNLIRAATPLFKGKTLDDIRSDRSEMEEEAIKKVQTLADKYGIEIIGVTTSEPVLNPEYAKELSLKAAAELRSGAAEASGKALALKVKTVADGLGVENKEISMMIAERAVAVETAANGDGNVVVSMPAPGQDTNPEKLAKSILSHLQKGNTPS